MSKWHPSHLTITPYVPERPTNGQQPVFEKKNILPKMSVQKAVMDHYTAQGTFKESVAEAWVTKLGYQASSLSSVLYVLVKAGYIHRLGKGVFAFAKPFATGQLKVDHA